MELEFAVVKYNYWIATVLMMIGLYGIIAKNNLVKKVIGLQIFQTSIILFFISTGVKNGGSIPILFEETYYTSKQAAIDPTIYNNPLPHVLMLTAIVVGVAILGVALALVQRIHHHYGSVEENEVMEAIAE